MLDILMSGSNKQVHIDEINENVTEFFKYHPFSLFPGYSELCKYMHNCHE